MEPRGYSASHRRPDTADVEIQREDQVRHGGRNRGSRTHSGQVNDLHSLSLPIYLYRRALFLFYLCSSVSDPEPHGSACFCPVRIRIRINLHFLRIRIQLKKNIVSQIVQLLEFSFACDLPTSVVL